MKYEVNGQVYEFPDDMSEEDVLNIISTQDPQAFGQTQEAPVDTESTGPQLDMNQPYGGLFTPYEQVATTETVTETQSTDPLGFSLGGDFDRTYTYTNSLKPEDLPANSDWMTASRIIWEGANNREFDGTPEELADFGLATIQWFENNLPGAVVDASSLASKSMAERQAFLYLMDTYDSVGYSLGTTARALKYQAQDITNWVGLATIVPSLGTSGVALNAGRVASKEALKKLIRFGIITGAETGVVTATQNVAEQSVEVAAGRKDEIDNLEVAGAGALGFGAGFALGPVADIGVNTMFGKQARKVNKTQKQLIDDIGSDAQKQADNIVGPVDESAVRPGPNEQGATPPVRQETAVSEAPNVTTPPSTVADAVVEPPLGAPRLETPPPRMGDIPPQTIQDVVGAVKDLVTEVGQRATPEAIQGVARQVSDTLQSLGINSSEDVAETLVNMGFSRDQVSTLARGAQQAYEQVSTTLNTLYKDLDNAATTSQVRDIEDRITNLEELQKNLRPLEMDMSAASGSDLGSRRGGIFVGDARGLSVEEILRRDGFDPATAPRDQIERARQDFTETVDKRMKKIEGDRRLKELDAERERLLAEGDITGALKLSAERDALETTLNELDAKKAGFGTRAYRAFNDVVMSRVNEYIVSTILAISSTVANTIPSMTKTLLKPMLNYIIKGPLDQAALREMTITYSTMLNVRKAALDAAKLSWKYERGTLTDDFSTLLENAPQIAGMKGKVLRTIPRFMQATDSFFEQVIYRSHVAGEAAFSAMQEGARKGLSGKKLDDFVNKKVDKALKDAFKQSNGNDGDVRILDLLRKEAVMRGYKGEALVEWVKTQLAKDGNRFQRATNEGAMNYADVMLFRKRFSGDNPASKAAQMYERFINRNPIMRIMGQVFFRTPVRVFEEGIRLTPGLNLIHPTFLNDLRAPMGSPRQVRAQGEALLGFSFVAGVMALYASGNITGAGPENYKQNRGKQNAKEFKPYTMNLPWGYEFNYRNYDPFATPVKIVVNALDRYKELQYRKSQGEYVENEMKEAAAWLGVAAGSVGQAIRDANLTSGLQQGAEFIAAFFDPESNYTQFEKFAGQKAALLVPRQFTQVMQSQNPVLADPVTLEQFFKARINPGDPLVPKQYDSIGNVRTNDSPMLSIISGIDITTPEGRAASLDEKSRLVNQELSRIEHAADTSFMAPYKRSELGNVDLRKTLTADGTETLYDRWQKYVRESDLKEALYESLVGEDGSYGNASNDGTKTIIARKIITAYRNAAFYRMLGEEAGVNEMYLENIDKKSRALAGEADVMIPE